MTTPADVTTLEVTVRPEDGVELAAQVLGAGAPVLLLLAGAAWSRDWWDDDLCARLVARGRRVVRYDQRDTGASTTWPVYEPGYDGGDLVTDALAVLDAAGVDRAHVAGLSAGGGVAQQLALAHPERVAALTLLSTTAVEDLGEELPGPSADLADGPREPHWDDPDDVVEALVAGERAVSGPDAFDEEHVRAIARRVVARSHDLAASLTNHFLLAEPPHVGRLADLAVPTTVVHGGADPMFPPEHGRALARAIPGARYVELPGIGHQLPPPRDRDLLVELLTDR